MICRRQHEAVEEARACAWPDQPVFICHGEERCDHLDDPNQCPNCKVIDGNDRRSTRQILNEMNRAN